MYKKIPVHIITGFLGSGKTTFLNHFIKELLPERILVIENECGATNVDGALVMDGVEEVVELSAGCLCCSLSSGLLDVLEMASERRDEFDRIVIETTGIADPSSILQVFLADPRVARVFDLEQVICLADAGLLEEWLEDTEEALRQVALADVILINKVDMVSLEYLPVVEKLITSINPNAYTFSGMNGIFPVEEIMKVGNVNPQSVEEKLTTKEAHHHANHNSHGISTFTLTFEHPFDLNALSLELTRIVNLYRDQVYRVKGILSVFNYPNRVILQSVRTTFTASDGNKWEKYEPRESKLVFIGRGIKKEVFEKRFKRYLIEVNPHQKK